VTLSYPSRRSTRLRDYDYAQAGAYFVTICTQDRLPLLGSVTDGRMHLSPAGEMVARVWSTLGQYYAGVSLDSFTVMPNHLHGIIVLSEPPQRGEEPGESATPAPSLSFVVGRFKSFTTHEYGKGAREQGWPRYRDRFWQARFYDHVIRNERGLDAIREYIANNPLKWELDRLNPDFRAS
jgi:REP element-mobilizing transposase RayT